MRRDTDVHVALDAIARGFMSHKISRMMYFFFFSFAPRNPDVYGARARAPKCFDRRRNCRRNGRRVGRIKSDHAARARTSPKVVTSSRNRFPYFSPVAILRSAGGLRSRLFIRASYNEGLRAPRYDGVQRLYPLLSSFLLSASLEQRQPSSFANHGSVLIGRLRCINPR